MACWEGRRSEREVLTMREILFRGKRIDNGEWVEGSLLLLKKPILYAAITYQHEWEDGKLTLVRVDIDPSTVGQYTGLTDKNGKRIFEGDIVQFRTSASTFRPMYVLWYEEGAQFVVSKPDNVRSYPMDRSWEYEGLGNIYDNPELMEGGGTT